MTLSLDTTWPTTLPLPAIEYSGGPGNVTLVSPAKMIANIRRSRFTKSYPMLSVTWVLTLVQYTTFKTFFETTLGSGGACFPLELRYPKNSELTEWAVRFAGGFNATHNDGLWQVQVRVILLNEVVF